MKTLLPLLALTWSALLVSATDEPFHGEIQRFDPAFSRLVPAQASIDKLAEGIHWAEGPVWYHDSVVLSDPPANIAWQWKPGATSVAVFLKPSGGAEPKNGFREPGSNGLMLDRDGRLLLCQDGTRRIARYDHGSFTTIADRYDGKRFSSPNDLAVRRDGEIYFTDPPYGLDGVDQSPLKEQPVNGVYRVATDGTVSRVISDLTYPNGIAFSPDEKVLYVNVSDSADTRIMAYDVQSDGTVAHGRRFFDANSAPQLKGAHGVFDGMKVDHDGNLWTSGPGGILVVSPDARLLGRFSTGVPTANCAFAPDGYLYITANHFLLRVKTLTRDATM